MSLLYAALEVIRDGLESIIMVVLAIILLVILYTFTIERS